MMIFGKKIVIDSAQMPDWMRVGAHHVILHPAEFNKLMQEPDFERALAQRVMALSRDYDLRQAA